MSSTLSLVKLLAYSDVSVGDALIYSLMGLAVIFSVLAFLILAVVVYKAIFALIGNKNKQEKQKPAPAPAPSAPAPVVVNSEEEIAAVIGAVMAIYYTDSATGKTAPFKVKSILRLK